MPRSLVKLNTEYCGGSKEKSKQIKQAAKEIFTDIRGYQRAVYHAYPATLAYNLVITGMGSPLLRDEIFCLLIKQTTGNPSPDSMLLALKLLYLCCSSFAPSSALRPCLLSHIAQFAPAALPEDLALGFQQEGDVAALCYIALQHVELLNAANIPIQPPSMADIEGITTGALAKRSGKFEDTIRTAESAEAITRAAIAATHKEKASASAAGMPPMPPLDEEEEIPSDLPPAPPAF